MNQYEKWEKRKVYYLNSTFCQMLEVIFNFCGKQWSQSKAVATFVAYPSWEQQAGQNSLTFRLWQQFRLTLTKIYESLKLEKLLSGSLLISPMLWCILTVFCSAILPTMAVLGLVLLAYLTHLLDLLRHRDKLLQKTSLTSSCLLMGFYYMGITFTSVDLASSLPVGLIMTAFMCVPVLLVNVANSKDNTLILTRVLVLSATLVALYGIYQFIFGAAAGSGWVDTDMFDNNMVRVYSTLQNPNMLAQYLVLVLPFGGALLLTSKDWNSRFVWLFCCGVIVVTLLCTYSRGGWLGALIAGVIFFLLFQPKLLTLAPIALIALYFLLPETIIERFTSIGNLEDSSTSYRLAIWMGSIALLKDYWVCGIGPGVEVFGKIYPFYSYSSASAQHSHNLFLQMMVDGGLVMLVLFLMVILVFCRETFRYIGTQKQTESRLFVIASISGAGGFLAQGMTDYSFYNYRVALAFWIALGMGIAWTKAKEPPSTKPQNS